MRRFALPAAALLVLLTAGPALASAGLPKIASLELGPHKAAIHIDSQSARIGSNTLTVEITDVPTGHTVHLRFIGPSGQELEPELRPLTVLTGPADAHGDSHAAATEQPAVPADAHGHSTPTDSHSTHGTDSQAAPSDNHKAAGGTFNARAAVDFPESGTWKVILIVEANHDDMLQAEASFPVTYGGPNRAFVSSAGVIIGGSILYGAVARRRKTGGR